MNRRSSEEIDIFAAPPSRFTASLAEMLALRIEIVLATARKEEAHGHEEEGSHE